MKKIIITAVLFVFSSMSANALDMGILKQVSITGGLGQNTSVWGASADEKNFAENNTTLVSTNLDPVITLVSLGHLLLSNSVSNLIKSFNVGTDEASIVPNVVASPAK